MKKIINKKVYDTETAKFVGEFEYGNSSDFKYLIEALYKTRNGNWFLYYEGGPMTKYAVKAAYNMTSGSSGITIFTEEEAYEWLEEYNKTDAIEKYFSNMLDEA